MQRYFPVYAAILGVLALLLFLSPQIAKFISADSEPTTGREILKNVHFNSEQFNPYVWQVSTKYPANSISFSKGAMLLENQLANDNFTLLTQRLSLKPNKTYRLQIDYSWHNNQKPTDQASLGILKHASQGQQALVYALINAQEQQIDKYFTTEESFVDPYFYILLEGSGSLEISSLSLLEFNQTPTGVKLDNSTGNKELNLKVQGGLVEPASIPVDPSPTPTSSVEKSDTNTKIILNQAQKENSQVIYGGWNVIASADDYSSTLFASRGLTGFQMFGGKWYKSAKDSSHIFSSKGATYVYNPSQARTIDINKSDKKSELSVQKGWNLLVNNSAEPINANSMYEINSVITKITDLILKKKISKEVYLIKSSETGVSRKKIDLLKEAIPGNSAYWIYLFN